jgi:hypothetical protein
VSSDLSSSPGLRERRITFGLRIVEKALAWVPGRHRPGNDLFIVFDDPDGGVNVAMPEQDSQRCREGTNHSLASRCTAAAESSRKTKLVHCNLTPRIHRSAPVVIVDTFRQQGLL